MEWFEDEEFWSQMYPFMFPPERMALAEEQVSQVLALTGATTGSVLDLACGPGRHASSLAARGFTVTGVDLSPYLLNRAKASGAAVEWILEDMRRFERPEAFDLACSLFTSFGYFEDEQDDRRVLANIYRSLKPGGQFVIDVMSKESLARRWSGGQWTDGADGRLLAQRPRVHPGWGRVSIEWILIEGESARTFHVEHNLYSGRELKDRLLDAGFSGIQLYGSLGGAPYDLDAMRLVAVARK